MSNVGSKRQITMMNTVMVTVKVMDRLRRSGREARPGMRGERVRTAPKLNETTVFTIRPACRMISVNSLLALGGAKPIGQNRIEVICELS